jgi:hypothetical protein
MGQTFIDILAGVAGLVAGAAVGFLAGRLVRSRRAWFFWTAAAAIMLVGVGIASYGQFAAERAAWVFAIGVWAGGFTGLKYGAARVPGFAGAAYRQEEDTPPRNTVGGFIHRSSDEVADTVIKRH